MTVNTALPLNIETMLAAARHRRAPHLWPPPQQNAEDEPVLGTLVRLYVLPDDERARVLAAPPEGMR